MAQSRPIHLQGRPVGSGAFPLIITPLVGRTAAELMGELDAILPKRPDMLEWRVDFFEGIADADAVVAAARELKRRAGAVPILLTRRNSTEGGQPVAIPEAAVVAMYSLACEARCVDLIDYELSNAPADIGRLREVSAANGVAMVMSYHNFERTPDAETLVGRFAHAERLGADVAKVAVMPRDPQDVLTLLGATYQATQALRIPVISMSMGGLGAVSRMMGWVYGSAATFAVGKSSSAPGQLAIDELRATLDTVRRAVRGQ
ncbi:type I 3-dehydroquinate dehydratase [Ramlibacter sp.]|uniref:type I 3-dehydroquinate dehydratase n=1 Tax=Ramlibacter sp. TaxID=1917967 RepID=UPI002C0D7322|nr:type I 3-dehydroquinate dehydratase [Ramlibacter sp.]HWI80414.1 type I 3-dehydroquinate dehydratase [Ramlibacter sp.]